MTNVIATNNFNKFFGIENGQTYSAELITETLIEESIYSNGLRTEIKSWLVNGSNYSFSDFKEI